MRIERLLHAECWAFLPDRCASASARATIGAPTCGSSEVDVNHAELV